MIDLQFNGKADGFALQQEVSNWCHQQLLPALDNALKKYEATENVISIDRLEINIAVDAGDDWLKLITGKIIQQTEEKLSNIYAGYLHGQPFEKTPGINIKTPEISFKELLIYFLRNGFLPWNNFITAKEVFDTQLEQWLKSASDESISSVVALLKNQYVQQRFLYQLTRSNLISFMAGITKSSTEEISRLFHDAAFISEYIGKYLPDFILIDFKKIILEQLNKISPGNIFSESIAVWLHQIIQHQTGIVQKIEIEKLQAPEFKKTLEKIMIAEIYTLLQPPDEIKINDPAEVLKAEEKGPIEKITDEGIYINNAGAVIIAPFLPMLFSRVSLVADSQILNADIAVNLLYNVITGKEYPAEFELVFPKILCGLEIETVVNTTIPLSEVHKKEADKMLASVIEYWSILKNTSINGLRESFLQREGKLTFKNNEWLLQIEQKAYDMLLNHLPWNISMIKLPWMKFISKTEWVF